MKCPTCGADNWDWPVIRCVKCGKLFHGDVDVEEITCKERPRKLSRRTWIIIIQFLVLDVTIIAILAWYGSGLDWTEFQLPELSMPFYILALTPLVLWTTVLILLSLIARDEAIEVRVNLLALAGAVIGLCSCVVGWEIDVRHGDTGFGFLGSAILLLAYPFTVITPLASIGSVAVLLLPYSMVDVHSSLTIEPISAYLLGWVSVGILFASIWTPFGLRYDGHWRLLSGSRLLTLHFNRIGAEAITDLHRG